MLTAIVIASTRIVALLATGLLAPAVVAEELDTGQPSPREMADALGVQLPRLPWHLADIWWNFEKPTEDFEELSVEVTIDRDIPSTYNLYIAPVGIAQINGLKFYGGIQTNINGWVSKESRTRVHRGKGGIFSRWSKDEKTPIGLQHVRMKENSLCESAGYEGEFCSVRRPFAWTKGTYTYSIVKTDQETINGKDFTWFACRVRSHETNQTTEIGSLSFEGTTFSFWQRHAAFVEVYATSKIRRSGIPKVKVTFGYPRLNGKQPKLTRCSAHYNLNRSPQCARAFPDKASVVVEVGPMFKRDKGSEVIKLVVE